jgi:hypothetical protein
LSKRESEVTSSERIPSPKGTDGHMEKAGGTTRRGFPYLLLQELHDSLWMPADMDGGECSRRLRDALSLLSDLRPREGVENMLAVQMVSTHGAAMECLRRAMKPRVPDRVRDQELKHAAKLLNLYTRQLVAFDKHRGKGQQKVTVEHVYVAPGGQAIVGHVEADNNRTSSRQHLSPGNGASGNSSDAHHAAMGPSSSSRPPVRRRSRP